MAQDYQRQFNVSQSQYGVLAQAVADAANRQLGQRVGLEHGRADVRCRIGEQALMAEPLLEFDPTSEDAANSPLSVWNTASYGVTSFSPDAALQSVQWASSVDTEGALPASFKDENRTISITVECLTAAALRALQAKVMKISRERGTLKYTLPNSEVMIFDLLARASFSPTFDDKYVLNTGAYCTVEMSFAAKPYGRGASTSATLTGGTATSKLPIVATATGIKGDVPALGTLTVANATNAKTAALWGIQSRYYSAATSAALVLEAEDGVASGAALNAGSAGASGGGANKVMRHLDVGTSGGSISYLLGYSSGTQTLSHVGSVTHSDGRVTRWGPDEPNATEIPGDLTFSTQIPGGFKDLSCSLLRRIDLDYPDLGLFDRVRVYGPGNRTVWEGRMAQFPRSHGDGFQIVPGAVGHSAALTDNPSFREIYVDRDLSHWGARASSAAQPARHVRHGRPDRHARRHDRAARLATSLTRARGRHARSSREAWYDAHGIPIGSALLRVEEERRTSTTPTRTGSGSGPLDRRRRHGEHRLTGNLRAAGPGTGTVTLRARRSSRYLQHSTTRDPPARPTPSTRSTGRRSRSTARTA
jgi:hypothetical protein